MTNIKTSDPNMQWAVDMANSLMERSHRYRIRRHRDDPNPDFSKTRWYMGMRQRHAIGYCARAMSSTDVGANSSQFMGFPVTLVQEDDHAELVEQKG